MSKKLELKWLMAALSAGGLAIASSALADTQDKKEIPSDAAILGEWSSADGSIQMSIGYDEKTDPKAPRVAKYKDHEHSDPKGLWSRPTDKPQYLVLDVGSDTRVCAKLISATRMVASGWASGVSGRACSGDDPKQQQPNFSVTLTKKASAPAKP